MSSNHPNNPNMIWIFGDQHRAQSLGHAGDPNVRTPHLDTMAARGTSFTQAVSGSPWCAPFRGALFTGMYNHLSIQKTPQLLDPELPLVTDVFNAAGYHTAYFGKWHLNGDNQMSFVPRDRRGRFATWLGYENNNAQYETCIHGHDTKGRDDQDPRAEPLIDYETDALTDRFIKHLDEERPSDKSFFAVLSVQPPHDPYVAPPDYMERHKPESIELRPNVPPVERVQNSARNDLAGYYAQIENLDHNVGRILEYLEESGLAHNTWVFFFSDHGDMHGSHGYTRKSSPWEESIRIPMIVQAPTGHQCPQTSTVPMNHVDIGSTSLGLCGLTSPDTCQGTDWSHELLPDKPAPAELPDSAFLQHVYRKRFECLNRTWRGIRTTDGWKYIVLEGQPFALFNLNEDPYELNNLAFNDGFNAERESLQKQLEEWLTRTGDTFHLPPL